MGALDAQAFTYTWTFAARWNEASKTTSGGVTTYPEEFYPGKEYDVRPHRQLRAMYPSAIYGDGNNQTTSNNLWVAVLQSPYLYGNATNLVRARDVSEDWDLNFIDPADATDSRLYWFNWYADNTAAGQYVTAPGYPRKMSGGPHAGEAYVGNANLLAMGDDKVAMLDADGSLSYYNIGGFGSIDYNSTTSNFSGGSWDGDTLVSKLKYMIGYEQSPDGVGYLYFLEGSSTLHIFNRDLVWKKNREF